MYTIENCDDHKLFRATPGIRAVVEPKIIEAKAANRRFVSRYPVRPPVMPITGTFIYAHSPNYRGKNMLNCRLGAWVEEFGRLKELGIDTVILQASVWNELGECYYRSHHFARHRQWDVVEPMLEAAYRQNLRVFLGGYGSTSGWSEKLSSAVIAEEVCNQIECFRELMHYRDRFDGFYFAPETAYAGFRDHDKERALNELYRKFFAAVKDVDPNLAVLMSPATKYFPGKMTEMRDSWLAILNGVPLDIMAPQDSIGCCGIILDQQPETYPFWQEVCCQLNIRFWSNIEIFERKDSLEGDDYNLPAPPERVAAQINHAAPFAEKLICWEGLYYLDRQYCGDAADLLREKIFNSAVMV